MKMHSVKSVLYLVLFFICTTSLVYGTGPQRDNEEPAPERATTAAASSSEGETPHVPVVAISRQAQSETPQQRQEKFLRLAEQRNFSGFDPSIFLNERFMKPKHLVVTDEDTKIIQGAMYVSPTNELVLEGSLSPAGITILVQTLADPSLTLRILHLKSSSIDDQAASEIARALTKNRNLYMFTLSGANLTWRQISRILVAFDHNSFNGKEHSSRTFGLYNNRSPIDDRDVLSLADFLEFKPHMTFHATTDLFSSEQAQSLEEGGWVVISR